MNTKNGIKHRSQNMGVGVVLAIIGGILYGIVVFLFWALVYGGTKLKERYKDE